MGTAAEQANQHLVNQLIARGALWSRPLIDAFRATPRHRFLDRVWHYQRQQNGWREINTQSPGKHELRLLYADRALTTRLSDPVAGSEPVPISSSSQPSLMAEMLEELQLKPGLNVLEIGAGTGYNAALLAHVVGRVISLDVDCRILAEAADHLCVFPERNVDLRHGDGRLGWPSQAPFDRILVTAASLDLEPVWTEQLVEGGILLVPLNLAPGLAFLLRGTRRGGVLEGHLTRPAYFMPLRSEHEEGRDDASFSAAMLPSPDPLPVVTAPWADWIERKVSCSGPGLLPSLAFLGWLQGYTIAYQSLADGQVVYGIGDLVSGHACWLGLRQWRATGMAGRQLGERLWHDFLDAGGPWPSEYGLRASPLETSLSQEDELISTADMRTFRRNGIQTRQTWTLSPNRQRPTWS